MFQVVRCGFHFAATTLLIAVGTGVCEARVYFVPDDFAPYQLNSGDTLYLRPGGTFYSYTEIGGPGTSPGSITMNVEGGRIYGNVNAGLGSRVNIYSGFVHSDVAARNGSAINVFGGQLYSLSGAAGSSVALHGAEFRIDGQPIDGLASVGQSLQFDVPEGALLSGTYSDGTPFAFTSRGMSRFAPGTLSLNVTEVPPLGPLEIIASTDPVPSTLRSGQRLLIDATIDQSIFAGHGSTVEVAAYNYRDIISMGTVNVTDGELGSFVALEGSEFNISGGRVRGYFESRPGSVVNLTGGVMDGGHVFGELHVTGGAIYDRLWVGGGGVVNINGGAIYGSTRVDSNGSLKMSDGTIGGLSITNGGHVSLSSGSAGSSYVGDSGMIELSGGTLGQLSIGSGGIAKILGGEFALDGVPISGLDSVGDTIDVVVGESSAISGTLSDGTPFMFSAQDVASDWTGDQFDGTLKLQRTAIPVIGPTEFVASRDAIPSGVRRGQSLLVDATGIVGDNFSAGPGSVVNVVTGGDIGTNFEATAAQVNVTGGVIRYQFDAAAGTVVHVSGGEIFGSGEILNGSRLNLSGGTVYGLRVKPGGTADIVGGVADNLEVVGGLAEISGGKIETGARIYAGGRANISGGTVNGTLQTAGLGVVHISAGTFTGPLLAYKDGEIQFSGGEALGGFVASVGGRVIIENGVIRGESVALGEVSPLFPPGGEVLVRGGVVDGPLTAQNSSVVEISGGVLADGFKSAARSKVLIGGGEFKLNGEPIAGLENVDSELQLDVAGNSTLTGVLADGTPFAFQTVSSTSRYDSFAAGSLRLKTVDLPATSSRTIYAPTEPVPLSIRGEERLIVNAGGQIDNNFMAGPASKLEVYDGGIVGRNLEAIGAIVEINGGEIGPDLGAFGGSVVNIRAGKVDAGLEAHAGSVVNISGGVLGAPFDSWNHFGQAVVAYSGSVVNVSGGDVNGLRPQPGSTINVTGGRIGDYFQSQENTTVRLAGGSIGDHFATAFESQLRIVGGDFRVNGAPIAGLGVVGDTLQVEVDPFSVLTGVFADGTPFSFAHADSDYISGAMTLEVAALPVAEPRRIRASTDPIPLGIRGPQLLDVDAGATLSANFNAGIGSTVNIHPGSTVWHNFEAIGGTVNMSGGIVHQNFNAFEGSVVNIAGGSVGPFSDAFHGSVVNVAGGTVGENFSAHAGSTVNIFSGTVRDNFNAYDKSIVNISGGTIDRDFQAFSESQVNLFGTAFFVNGIAVDNLQLGEALTLFDRDVMLTGKLADGSEFSFQLEDNYSFSFPYWYERPRNFFDAEALLTLTRVHNPGDYDGDGRVTDADRAVWFAAMSTGDLAADGNFDRQITIADLAIWEQRLGTVYFGVPERNSAALALLAAAISTLWHPVRKNSSRNQAFA